MKFAILTVLASVAVFCSAGPAATNAPATFEARANGLYITTTDAAGKKHVKFTPEDELYDTTALAGLGERSEDLQKRRDGCGVAVSNADSDEANRRLLDELPNTDTVVLNSGSASYHYNSATSFICVYSGGWKPKSSIVATWDWVKRYRCGPNTAGYGQVQDGTGDWTAGYTWNGDHYC